MMMKHHFFVEPPTMEMLESKIKDILYMNGFARDTKFKFEHDDVDLSTIIYVDRPEQVNILQKTHIGSLLSKLSHDFHRGSIKISNIPIDIIDLQIS